MPNFDVPTVLVKTWLDKTMERKFPLAQENGNNMIRKYFGNKEKAMEYIRKKEVGNLKA